MDAAPLDGRDDAGGDDAGRDGRDNGSGDEHRRPLPAAAGLIGVLVALIAVLWLLGLTGNDRVDVDSSDSSRLDEDPFEVPTTSSPLREPESMIEVAPEGEELPSRTARRHWWLPSWSRPKQARTGWSSSWPG